MEEDGARFIAAGERVARWFDTVRLSTARGEAWPDEPGEAEEEAAEGLYSGVPGVVLFFLQAYRSTGEQRYLDEAVRGARWMAAAVPETRPFGLHTGLGGLAFTLDLVARATGDEAARAASDDALSRVRAGATRGETGVHWHGLTEAVWGTAGVGFLLLHQDRDGSLLELAAEAADWLVGQAEDAPGGIRWSLGPGIPAHAPIAAMRAPGFAHGTAGTVGFLAALAERTGEQRYLDAAVRGAEHVLTVARHEAGRLALPHHLPDAAHWYPLGWCYGSTGAAWMLRWVWRATGDERWMSALLDAANHVRYSGIPNRLYPGFWDNVGRCCGSTGVASLFQDLFSLTGDEDARAFAIRLSDDLLARATDDGYGMRWSNIEFRASDPVLPPLTGWMQGAAGVGAWLFRLGSALEGRDDPIRLPEEPF